MDSSSNIEFTVQAHPIYSDYEKVYFNLTQRVSSDGGSMDGKISWVFYSPDTDLNIEYLKATDCVSMYQLLYMDGRLGMELCRGYICDKELLL